MPAGRPPLFDDPIKMQELITEYFEKDCKKTLSGLAYHLGFESRQSMYEYEEKPEFTYIIKRAKIQIEQMYEELVQGTTPTGSIFVLKNMGWKDKTEAEVYGKDGAPLIQIIMPPGE
jgi:hypothetical protein